VRYQRKTPWKNGTTHVAFEPVELMAPPRAPPCDRLNRQSCRFVIAKLAALVPPPRALLIRFHGVFALPEKMQPPVEVKQYSLRLTRWMRLHPRVRRLA